MVEKDDDKISIKPGVGLWALFRTMRYSSWVAIGELVDNAIASYVKDKERLVKIHGDKYRLRVDINFINGSNPEIQIKDNAGGIPTSQVHRAFTPAMPPVDKSGIGQYGIGMKSSACWYSNFFTVQSRALDEPFRRIVTFDIPTIIDKQTETVPITKEPVSNPKIHGTTIIMRNLNQPIPIAGNASRVRSYLKSMYRDFLRSGELILTLNDEQLEVDKISYLKAPYWPDSKGAGGGPEIEWFKDFEVELSDTFIPSEKNKVAPKIRCRIGLLEEGRTKQAGLALLWRRRVVQGAGAVAESPDDVYRPPKIFGGSNAYRKQRLIGEIDVSDLTVTSFKDQIIWADGQEDEALTKIRKILDAEPAPMLRMAENYRVTLASKAVMEHLEKTLNDVVSSATKSIIESSKGQIGAEFPIPITEEPPEPMLQNSEDIFKKTITLIPNFEQNYVLQVKDQMDDPVWLRVKNDEESAKSIFTVNRAHPFMLSFTGASPDALEPVLRIALAIGIAEVEGIKAGYETAPVLRMNVCEILRQFLSQTSDAKMTVEDE